MQGRCDNNPLDQAEDVCNECGGEFCAPCLVYPRGQKRPPVCKACAILKSGVRMTGRNEQWENANRKGIRKRRKSVQEAAAADPQDHVFRFFDEEGSDIELRDRASLAELADMGSADDEPAPKKGRRWRRKDDNKDDKRADNRDDDRVDSSEATTAGQLTSLPIPEGAEEPEPTEISASGDGVDIDEFLAEERRPKRGFRRRADDQVAAKGDPADDNGKTADEDTADLDDADESVDIGAALSVIDAAAASHQTGTEPVDSSPAESPPSMQRSSAPRATELLSKLRETGGGAQAVEPAAVAIPDDPWVAVTESAGAPEPSEADPFFEPAPETATADAFVPVASPESEPDPFAPAEVDAFAPADVDAFVPADPLPAPSVDPTMTPAAEADPFAVTSFSSTPDVQPDDPFVGHGAPDAATLDPFGVDAPQPTPFEPPAAAEPPPTESPFAEPVAVSEPTSPAPMAPETTAPEPTEPATTPMPEPAWTQPAPTADPIADPIADSVAEANPFDEPTPDPSAPTPSTPSSTNPPPGAADRDADGNWIPPVLRGMAPVQERQALPKRRGG